MHSPQRPSQPAWLPACLLSAECCCGTAWGHCNTSNACRGDLEGTDECTSHGINTSLNSCKMGLSSELGELSRVSITKPAICSTYQHWLPAKGRRKGCEEGDMRSGIGREGEALPSSKGMNHHHGCISHTSGPVLQHTLRPRHLTATCKHGYKQGFALNITWTGCMLQGICPRAVAATLQDGASA